MALIILIISLIIYQSKDTFNKILVVEEVFEEIYGMEIPYRTNFWGMNSDGSRVINIKENEMHIYMIQN